jgi:hypothetical protein
VIAKEYRPLFKETANQGTFAEYCILIDKRYSMQWFHAEIARQLEQGYKRLERGENVRLMIFMPPRHGKQLDHDTPIFTTVGWKRHGDLVIGDYVFSPSGKPIKVLSLSDESLQDCEIDFHDGTSIK